MSELLPNGVLGLCVVGLLGAFMSTISTHFNLGPSYLINDIYKAFLVKNALEKHYILVSRCATGLVALTGMILSVFIESIADMWQFVCPSPAALALSGYCAGSGGASMPGRVFLDDLQRHRGHLPEAGAPGDPV